MFRKSLVSCLVSVLFLATSCNTVVGDFAQSMLEYDMQQGLYNLEKDGTKSRQSKKDAKELQQLEKDGKCLTCRGIGQSLDGKYVCPKCNGTGLASKSAADDDKEK